MINRILRLLSFILILSVSLSSCLKEGRVENNDVLFVGEMPFFKSPAEVIDTTLINFIKQNNTGSFDYFSLYDLPFLATKVESQYRFDQQLFVNYADSSIRTPFEEFADIKMSSNLRFYDQNNNIMKMEMIFDTLLPTAVEGHKYHYYERYFADTMYVVGESGSKGRFIAYGMTDCHVERKIENADQAVVDQWAYNYPAWTVIIGNKVGNGISGLYYYECVADTNSYYKKYSIRAMKDKDGLSGFYK